MANNLLTIDMITRKSLEVLENNLVITRNINRQYDDSYAISGAKIGTSLRIRLPNRYTVRNGAALQVQDTNEQSTTLTVANQVGIDVNFTTAEMTMQLDDFSDIILKPAMSQLASYIDADVAATAYKSFYQTVGTPGTTPATSAVLLQGQQKLNEAAAVETPRFATVNPAANAGLVEGLKGLFNPTDTISRQFKNGMMGTGVLGYEEINMSQSIASFTTGSRSTSDTILVNGTISTQGQSTISIDGGTGSATVAVGDVFTIAGVYAVNPQTRATTGSLQQFVVTAANTASGGAWTNIAVSPPMYTASNPLATIDAFPVDNAAVTFVGAASTAYPQNLIYHKDAIAFATADLLLPQGVHMASRQVYKGISMRIVSQYDINNDRMPTRIDVLYGTSVIRPQMGVRLFG